MQRINNKDISICYWGDESRNDRSDKSAPLIHWAHANGFNAQTYAPLLAPISGAHIYASDLRGAGHTKLAAVPDELRGWEVYRDDLICVLEFLFAKHRRKILLGGHSMGATASIYAAATRPDLVAGLVLCDPVILPAPLRLFIWSLLSRVRGNQGLEMAAVARRRRAVWESREQIYAAYKGRGAFTNWQTGFLDAYLDGGLEERADGWHLLCAPEWEAVNYEIRKTDLGREIKNLQIPFTLLLAEFGSTTRNMPPFEAARVAKKIEIVQGSSHFLPMEKPQAVQDALLYYMRF